MSESGVATECPRCKSENPDGKHFCGDCGAVLDPAPAAGERIDAALRAQVLSILAERYKDQKLVELETTQAIAARFAEWAKLLAFFVGIPVAVLLLILAALGVKTYSDFLSQIEKVQADTTSALKGAEENAGKLRIDGEKLAAEYGNLQTRFRDTADIAAQLDTLSNRVHTIGITAAFTKFQQYLTRLGFRVTGGDIEIDVRKRMEVSGMMAYYDAGKRRVVIDSKYANDETVAYREYMHHVLLSAAPGPGASDELWMYYSIESALAWYFPCSFVGNPKPSSAVTWDLKTRRPFSDIRPNLGSATVDGTEIWGSAFWDIRQLLGHEAADKLLFQAWFKLRPADVVKDRGASFVKLILQSAQPNAPQIREIFARRGLVV